MDNCPFCDIELTDNKCKKCGFKNEEQYIKDFQVSKKDSNEKTFNMGKDFDDSKNIIKENNIKNARIDSDEYLVLGFFKRSFIAILDQIIILFITYLIFLITIKPNLEIPYVSFEYIAYFIINYKGLFITTILSFLIMNLLYYSIFNILFSGTLFSRLFSYRLYKKENNLSVSIIISRNLIMVLFNTLFLLFPYLFIFVSDYKQSLYDKLFGVYFAKKV